MKWSNNILRQQTQQDPLARSKYNRMV